jgi:hypothetical protein
MERAERARRLMPGLWAGGLLCVALVATPAPFATLVTADAGRVVGRILLQEGYGSLVLGIVLLVLERSKARRLAAAGQGSQFSTEMVLALGAVFCTVIGYFAIQPLLPAARAGQSSFTFGQLHAGSAACFAIKTALVLALAWRSSNRPVQTVSPTASS